MAWSQLEPTPSHISYMIFPIFLSLYALFSVFIRNRLHLSEPPLALVFGIIFGPQCAGLLRFHQWGMQEGFLQEFSRIILGLQVFVVGLELPQHYFKKHWKSLLYLLGPVMAFGWLICAFFIHLLFKCDISTAFIISACLTPTDPVLAASVLSNSRFSTRIPRRLKHLLSCESGCNDGASFPFLYVGLAILTNKDGVSAFKEWALVTVLYQCVLGTVLGIAIGMVSVWLLKFSDKRQLIGPSSFLVFYLLMAILSVGIASTLGLDDFLVAFSAGATFSHDGWFARRTKESKLNNILDLLLNSTFFIYLGTIIPWSQFVSRDITPSIGPAKLICLLILILCLRRIPIVVALKMLIPDLHTYTEAFFCGHFGPMGVGAVFLAIEARAHLQTGGSVPLPMPDPTAPNYKSAEFIWPIVSFVVLGSTLVHGLSVMATSIWVHFSKKKEHRAMIPGTETDPMPGMVHEDDESESASGSDTDDGWSERRNRIFLPS